MYIELMLVMLIYIVVVFVEYYFGSVLCIDLFFFFEIGLVIECFLN